MTTTESQPPMRRALSAGVRVLLGAARAVLLLAFVVVSVAALIGGSQAAYGALAGFAMVLVVFGLGTATVNAVAGTMPAASVLVALLTYAFQVVAIGAVFVVLRDSGLLDTTLDRRWLAAAVIAGTAGWLLGQIMLAARARIPIYDLTPGPESGPATRVPGDLP